MKNEYGDIIELVDIRPFKGIIYNPSRFSDLSNVLSPPYDVITTSQREQLLKQSSYNMVNLILGKTDKSGIENTFYKSARELWMDWRNQDILSQIPKPGVWKIKEQFSGPDGLTITRKGFISLIKVKAYNSDGIMGHEITHKKPKEDRFRLMEHIHANLSPIFFVYDDSEKSILQLMSSFKPEQTIHSKTNIDETVSIRSSMTMDKKWINSYSNYMKSKSVLIADGHHRYETALKFHNTYQGDESLDTRFTLGYFVSSSSPGLIIHPTHRGIHSIPNFNPNEFLSQCNVYFDILSDYDVPKKRSSILPSIRMKTTANKMVILKLKPEIMQKLEDRLFPSELASVDVVILQEIILKIILGLSDDDISHQINLNYYHSDKECLDNLELGKIQIALILSPLPIDLLFTITSKGGILPQKTTYFYPKCPVGLVMHSLEKD
ncbi:MAG: DUF1015 domain-containing protein [Candidatus Marinimicrobia bacterium]|nr:DUF1015 domain-containing protein [Candidatus Neomarinimicrobiota bacterium]